MDEILDVDEVDKKIIEHIQKEGRIDVEDLFNRIRAKKEVIQSKTLKLIRRGLLDEIAGINFQNTDLRLAKVEIEARNPQKLWNILSNCPLISNVYKKTGKYNLQIDLIASNFKNINEFVDNCLRKNPDVISIRTDFIIKSLKKVILHVSFNHKKFLQAKCNQDCKGRVNFLD